MRVATFQQKILSWYQQNKRNLPWRRTRDPYKILISEVMLQQTQVSRVIQKYKEFLSAFPSIDHLAKANTARLLKCWEGLGYWKRALFLRETARKIRAYYRGKFPKDPATLQLLPGIGHYTARAISCFAFQNQEAFLDTNIRRVYLHFFFKGRRRVTDREILNIAQKAVLRENPREWHQALMDYGALVLADKKINRSSSHYRRQSKFEGSFRFFRAKTLRFLLAQPRQTVPQRILFSFLKKELSSRGANWNAKEILESLAKDNLIRLQKNYFSIK
jgi:A/G-specific adenine glycosylase